jgi:hypothetical protein
VRNKARVVLWRHSHVKRLQSSQASISPLSELSIFQWKGKGIGAPSAYHVMGDELNYMILYMYTNMEEVQPYFKLFDKTY